MDRSYYRSSAAFLAWTAALLLQCANYDASQGYAGFLLPLIAQPGAVTPVTPPAPVTPTFSVSATVSNLSGTSGTLTLLNNGSDGLNFTADGTQTFISGVADGGAYNVTVSVQPGDKTCTVSGGAGNISSADVSVSASCVAAKRIWVTNSTFQGNFGGGGLAAADTACNNAGDGNWPGSGTYKAMVVQTGTRLACTNANCSPAGGSADWAFAANTSYVRAGTTTPILVTDANAVFVFGTLTNSFGAAAATYWTGLSADWTISTLHCSSWTSIGTGGAANQGERGIESGTDSTAISAGGGSPNCSNTRAVLCVEQ